MAILYAAECFATKVAGRVIMGMKSFFVKKMIKKWEEQDNVRLKDKLYPQAICVCSDVPYLSDNKREHLLDIYYNKDGTTDGKLPVFIDVHGGGFMSSYKELDKWFGYHVARKGFLVFNINYRLAKNDVTVFDQIEDVAKATKWIWTHLGDYNGDDKEVYICGHSAGGVLVTIESLIRESEEIAAAFSVEPCGIKYKALILDCAMMEFYKRSIPYWGMRSMIFEKRYHKKSYYKHLMWKNSKGIKLLPKTYMISNVDDALKNMTISFQRILNDNRVEHRLSYSADRSLGHMDIIYNTETAVNQKILEDMIAFIRA